MTPRPPIIKKIWKDFTDSKQLKEVKQARKPRATLV